MTHGRQVNNFDYKYITTEIEKVINSKKSSHFCYNALFSPEISFDYSNGWSVGKPRDNDKGTLKTFSNKVLLIDYYHVHHIFSDDKYIGRLCFFTPSIYINDEYVYVNGVDSIYTNFVNRYGSSQITFTTTDELCDILTYIRSLVLKYNTDENQRSYIYFSKDECDDALNKLKYDYLATDIVKNIISLTNDINTYKSVCDEFDEYYIDIKSLYDIEQLKSNRLSLIHKLNKLKQDLL